MSNRIRKPEPVGFILNSLIKDLGWEKGIQQHLAILSWPEIVGKEIARKTTPLRIRGSKLFVEVVNSSWMHHLHYLKPAILKKLNATLKPMKDPDPDPPAKPFFSARPQAREADSGERGQEQGKTQNSILIQDIVFRLCSFREEK